MIVLTTGRIFGRLLTIYQIPQSISAYLTATIHNPIILILIIVGFLIFIGMWMETLTHNHSCSVVASCSNRIRNTSDSIGYDVCHRL